MKTERIWTRREFNSAGLALGAAAFLGAGSTRAFARQPAAPNRDEELVLKVGVIGCGGRGTGAAVQALAADPNAMLWSMGDLYAERLIPALNAVVDSVKERAETPDEAVKFQIRADAERMYSGFDSFQRVLATGVDVVVLATPPGFRPMHLRAAVDSGKHVFCEKPVAVDGPGVRSVLESARIAKEKNLSLMSGFCWRYHDPVKETMARVLAGGIGQMRSIQTTYNTTGWIQPKPRQPGWSDAEFMTRNWHYFHPLSGDHIVEQAVHALDWQAWAMGDAPPERCYAVGGRQTRPAVPETGNVYDHFAVTYEYPGGVRANHMCRHWENTPSDNSALFIGSEGVCTMHPWQQRYAIEGANAWQGSAPANDMYQREQDVLFAAIRAGAPVNDGVFMSHSTLLGIMGRRAAYTGQVVTWEQIMTAGDDLNATPWSFGDRPIPAMAVPGKST